MNEKVTYHQQVSYCGKPSCQKCREGKGHGPYWYSYKTVNGRTIRTYIGKNLPSGVLAGQDLAPPRPVDLVPPVYLPNLSAISADPSKAVVRLFVLGQCRLDHRQRRQWQSSTDFLWQQPLVRALLGYLLCKPGRRAQKGQILEALWPDSDQESANTQLTRVMHSLGQVLEPARPQRRRSDVEERQTTRLTHQLLHVEGDWLILAEQARIWIDADAFESAIPIVTDSGRADQALRQGQSVPDRDALLREVVTLYGGDFMPEERQAPWILARRQSLKRSWIGMLIELADLYIEQGNTTHALEQLDRLLAAEPTNEAAVQRCIFVLAQQKRRGEALRAYHRLVDVLREEFNADPSAETVALYEAVHQGRELQGRIGGSAPRGGLSALVREHERALSVTATEDGSARSEGAERDQQEVLGTRAAAFVAPADPSVMQIGRSHQSPLVGRDFELDLLRTMLREVMQTTRMQVVSQRRATGIPLDTQRRPQCTVLLGEAGIGKTRLAEETAREALRLGWAVIWGRVYQQESGIPYHIWADVLRRVLVSTGIAPARLVWASTRVVPTVGVNPTQRLIQNIWQDVAVADAEQEPSRDIAVKDVVLPAKLQPLSALLPELSPLATANDALLTPEQKELRLWEAARDLLITASEGAPLLIVLDDIQWADHSSGNLLGYLARQLYGYPITFVVTCRDSELPTLPPHPLRDLFAHMQRERSVRTLQLEPLSVEEIGRLVAHLPDTMVQHIQAQSAGNPFFAEELARSTPPTLPNSIAVALNHRMSKLSTPCRQLLENAAVLGGSFEFSLLSEMETSKATVDEDTVLDLLEEALRSGVLTEEGTVHVTYHFWHPLLVSHLYDAISAIRRARIHQRAASILQRLYKGRVEEVAATITHHLVRAGAKPPEIAYYAELAGDWAYTFSAYTEAERHYSLALEHYELIRSPADCTSEQHLTLLERLAECAVIRGNFVEARRLYERILELSMARPEASEYDVLRQAMVWVEQGRTWRYNGDNARARECCERGEQVLRAAGVLEGPAWARLRHLQGSLYWQEGRYQEGRRVVQEALKFFAQQPRLPATPALLRGKRRSTRIQRTMEGDPVDLGGAYRLLGAFSDAEGHSSEALEHLNTALVIYEQADQKRSIGHVSQDISYLCIKKAAFEEAEAALRRALSLAEPLGDEPLLAVVYSNRGELAAAKGNLEEAENWYRKSLVLAERFNDREYISWWNTRLAGVLLDQGRFEEARTHTLQALRTGRMIRNNPCIGKALVGLANLRIAQARASQRLPKVRTRLLQRAKRDVLYALTLSGLEVETKTKCHLILAHVALLLGEDEADSKIIEVIEEASQYGLTLVGVKARRLLKE